MNSHQDSTSKRRVCNESPPVEFDSNQSSAAPLISTSNVLNCNCKSVTSMTSGPSQLLSVSSIENLEKGRIMDAAVGSVDRPLQTRLLDLSKNTNKHEGLDCSPKKKRKKITDGTKSCNCRKSKCLKLYCECFSNGLFCNENCGCSDCMNKHDQEEIILQSRQVIEGRNYQAFAPKVVLRAIQPAKESVKSTTPIARHRIGCSCLKSLCIKKYCECFQAGVGCFSGCRCEGCQNKFGRKGRCGKLIKVELNKNIIETERGTELSGPNIIIGSQEMRTKPSLNPLTPTIECSIPRIPSNSSFSTVSPASPTTSADSILELLESIECMSPSIGLGDEPQEPRP